MKIENTEQGYFVSDDGRLYGSFETYKDATDFMEQQLSVLHEYGWPDGLESWIGE